MEYISSTDTIIISPEFNDVLTDEYIEIISKFNKVIFSNCIYAEMAHGVGEYLYGPDTSESKACELAEDKAMTRVRC